MSQQSKFSITGIPLVVQEMEQTIFDRLQRLRVFKHDRTLPALLLAALYGWLDIAQKLLRLGYNPDIRDVSGVTALHVACRSMDAGSTEMVKALLDGGAFPDARCVRNGFTPLHDLIWQCHYEEDPWDCEGKVNLLLESEAGTDIRDSYGRTPILLASCISWDNSLFQLLYDRKAKLDVVDNEDRSILHYAAAYGDLDHIQYLCRLKLSEPNPMSQDSTGRTPMELLHWRITVDKKELWPNMRRPGPEVLKAFAELIKNIQIRRVNLEHEEMENNRLRRATQSHELRRHQTTTPPVPKLKSLFTYRKDEPRDSFMQLGPCRRGSFMADCAFGH
ncbi:hypothetical protein FBEOM_13054 [Fusarium beomiforme]|uniref:Ankyrin n=1 Tax=Fusarium beomiforme TaxID=44412 RepID=A0A9P5A6M3_9HYPO|nr:hypothetical protein FBEOM_13054 [Fusarium beomiforme]